MRLPRLFAFPTSATVPCLPVPAHARTAGERHRLGRSGEVVASLFGPPLPIDRPG
jgi:hypothetical protein